MGVPILNNKRPTFGNIVDATGFWGFNDVNNYFKKPENERNDSLKNEFTLDQWLYLIDLNDRVNPITFCFASKKWLH
jgi:hypothetical protein